MLRLLLVRTVHAVFVIWGAVTVIFLALRVVSGDPASLMLGPTATPEELASLRDELGLDQPLWTQYVEYLGHIGRLDFGESVRLGDSALPYVLERTPATLVLAVVALIFVAALGVPFGIAAGRRPGGLLDRIISTSTLVTQSMPTFWVGIMLILVLAGQFRVLPSGGAGTPAHLVLPAITLGLPFVALVARLVRSGVVDESRQGYVRTAHAKGLSQRVVFYVHVLRNVLVPVVTILGLVLGQFVGSAVVIETVFAWPGLGKLLVDSILYRDYAVVQAAVALIAMVYVVLNLIVDLTYGYLDPRIRLD